MPLNGSGTYAAPASTWNPAVTNTTINSTDWAALLADLTTALSTAMFKDGQATPTANIPMGSFKLTGLAAGNAAGNSVRYEQVLLLVGGTMSGNIAMGTNKVTGLGAASTAGDAARYEQAPVGLVTAKGDLISASAANTPALLALGSAGSIPMSRAAATTGLAYVAALKSAIYGWTYANAAGDVTNDIDIAAGAGMDSTGAYWITGAASTKQLDAAWAVGSAAGGLDTGVIGNSDYYLWAIARSDTGVVDYLFSLSSTAPTMPTNYDFKRLIGWFKRVAAAIVLFHTYETEGGGLEMNWDSPTLDVNLAATLTTARRTDAVKVPLNFSTEAHLNVRFADGAANSLGWIYCPDQTDLAPATGAAPLANLFAPVAGGDTGYQIRVRTSATGTVAARADTATIDTYRVSTIGFKWARRT